MSTQRGKVQASHRESNRREGSSALGPTIEARMSQGKALREKVSRTSHAEWKAPAGRPDVIKILQHSDCGRVPELLPIRYGRMKQSPFAFFRGSAAVMAWDLSKTPTTGIRVQACGDCHAANFGGFGSPERRLVFDLNDFDETLHAPWEWDLKRLATSFVLAARNNGATDRDARAAATAAARTYRLSMRALASMTALDIWYSRIDAEDIIKNPQAARRRTVDRIFPKMTEIVDGKLRLIDAPPLIYHPVAGELLCVVNDSKQLI